MLRDAGAPDGAAGERVRTEYLRTLQTRQIAISGPFVLLQGGLALIARLAVRDPAGKVRGVVAVIVDVPLLMKQVELDPPPPSLAIALRDQTGQVFWGDPAVFSSDPVVQHLEPVLGMTGAARRSSRKSAAPPRPSVSAARPARRGAAGPRAPPAGRPRSDGHREGQRPWMSFHAARTAMRMTSSESGRARRLIHP